MVKARKFAFAIMGVIRFRKMYAAKVFYVLVCLLFAVVAVRAQDHTIPFQKIRLNDSTSPRHRILFWDSQGGTDLIDVINWAVGAKPERMVDSSK